ncbi:MAG TPA: RHS repeat-associated core domain-containing protein, partial [Tepidisphaeraceae bacterium]
LRAHANRHIVWDYDALDRLRSESWTCSGEMDFDQTDQTRSYTYDLAGNRLTQTIDTTPTGGDVVSTSYTYDALNELKSSVTGNVTTSYKYDINGNRSEKNGAEGVLDYLYDTSDRLIKVRRGANTIFTASYDARTRRLSKIEGGTTTLFRYDGGTSFEELDGSRQILKQLVRAGGLGGGIGSILYTDETMAQHPRPVEFYAYDAVGNTVATMTSPDEIAQETVYEAFGNVIQQIGTSTNNRLRNTKERDASIGLDNDGFRYCDPETGRYLQRDPLGYKDGLNVYLSVHDNPVNWVDPQGLSADWKWWGSFVRNSIVETGKTVGGMAASSAQAVLHPIDTAVSAYNGSVNTTSAVMARTLEQGGSTGEAVFNGAAHLIGSATGSEKVGEAIVGVDNVTADELTTTERWTRGAAGASQLSFTAAAALERFGSGSAAAEGGEAAGAGGGDTAGLRPEGCFVAGTMVLSGVGELIPIETMGVGERVATDGGTANSPKAKADADPNATDVHSDWKKLSIDAVRVLPDGTNDVWQVKTLQSPEWIAHHRIRDGSFVPLAEVLDLKEMGLPNNMVGTIESIVAAPAVGKGPGRVVLTTVSHLNDYVFDLVLADQAGNSDNLGVTGFHKFYSEDRHRWISTVDLREGERLRGESGPIHVLSVTSLPGTQRVYNFTVEADHVYYVGDLTALTHNSCPVKPGDTGTYGDLKAKKRASGETEPLHMDHQPSLAAQVEARRNALGRNLTKGELAALKAETPAVASPTQVHQNSPTYGGRNTKAQVAADAVDLGRAATRDRAAFDEAMKNR